MACFSVGESTQFVYSTAPRPPSSAAKEPSPRLDTRWRLRRSASQVGDNPPERAGQSCTSLRCELARLEANSPTWAMEVANRDRPNTLELGSETSP